jgi:hypothetical protein
MFDGNFTSLLHHDLVRVFVHGLDGVFLEYLRCILEPMSTGLDLLSANAGQADKLTDRVVDRQGRSVTAASRAHLLPTWTRAKRCVGCWLVRQRTGLIAVNIISE